jgi:putative transposase
MPRATRQRHEPTDEWQQLRLLTRFPEQLTYELIRPVVLFGSSPAINSATMNG